MMKCFFFSSINRSIQPKVKLGNGKIVQAKGKGITVISTKKGMIIVTNVLYIPKVDRNFLVLRNC